MYRRDVLRMGGGAALIGVGLASIDRRRVWAEAAAGFDRPGLPELSVTMTETGFQTTPTEVAAGWTLLTFTSQMPEGNFDSCDLNRIPDGMTFDEAMGPFA